MLNLQSTIDNLQSRRHIRWARSRTTLLGGGLFLLALTLRLFRLGAQSLWLDEGSTWAEVTRRGWGALLADLWSPAAAYPLYHLLLKGWIGVAGDGEWALRAPSALAGALCVLAVFAVGRHVVGGERVALAAALLFATAPFALWHAQDAKVYSLVMLVSALLLLLLLRALERNTWRDWLLLAGGAVVALAVHRLMLLPLAGLALAGVWTLPRGRWRALAGARALLFATAGVYGLARAVVSNGWQESGHVAAGPPLGVWLTFVHFGLDRADIGGFAGLPLAVWLVPQAVLAGWGALLLLRDARRGNRAAVVILCAALVPLLLFAVALLFAPVYEARYATVAFPAWVLVLARPFGGTRTRGRIGRVGALLAGTGMLLVNAAVLFQPQHGMFSGAPVKEEWRQSITALAGELHPDDLLLLHPYYAAPLWDYYAPRVTPDPLPQAVVFNTFTEGDCATRYQGSTQAIRECYQRTYEPQFNTAAYGKKRALLLIAPEHAATVDRPKTIADLQAEGITATEDDRYGWVGLRFQYAAAQRTWPCGGETFVGVQVMCQSFPSFYGETGPAAIPQPITPLQATFGGEIALRGWSLDLRGGAAQPGGALPLTLFWQALKTPSHNYSMFLHLCRDCALPPIAATDRPPLNGYGDAGRTTTWRVGDPVHDERTLALPADLPPGRYTLLLGVRPADDPSLIDSRLPVRSDAPTLDGTRLVLGEIDVE